MSDVKTCNMSDIKSFKLIAMEKLALKINNRARKVNMNIRQYYDERVGYSGGTFFENIGPYWAYDFSPSGLELIKEKDNNGHYPHEKISKERFLEFCELQCSQIEISF